MDNLIFVGGVVGAVVVGLIIIGLMLTKLYRRASKEQAFVRTGLGGELVVKDGGALILPVFHDTTPINMKTLRLMVERRDTDALITKDSLRVDVKAEFYVKVKPDTESIAMAAQTLGQSTLDTGKLATLIEGKFVDALRSVAASMDMQDLHEKRSDFVQQVQNTVAEDLTKNGLELESVSLTGLDQTDIKHLNPENAFDAVGLAKLKAITEARRKERNDIEATTRVAIEQKNLDAEKQSLAITQEQEQARLEQERVIGTQRAEQEAALAKERADRKRESDIATIEAEQATAQSKVEREQATEAARITAKQALQIAEQTAAIAISEKSQAESEARAAADRARAEAVTAAQEVITAEATAKAEREKAVAIVAATQSAEQEAVKIRVKAQADREAAENQAAARQTLLEVEAREYEVKAEGERALVEAKNVTDPRIIDAGLRSEMIKALPSIIEAQYKAIDKVGDIRILSAPGGMGGFGGGITEGGMGSTGNVPGDLAQALTAMRLQNPMIDAFTQTMGFDLTTGTDGLIGNAIGVPSKPVQPKVAPKKSDGTGDSDPFGFDPDEARRLAGIEPKS